MHPFSVLAVAFTNPDILIPWVSLPLSFPLYNSDSEAVVDPLAKHRKVRVYFVEGNLLST